MVCPCRVTSMGIEASRYSANLSRNSRTPTRRLMSASFLPRCVHNIIHKSRSIKLRHIKSFASHPSGIRGLWLPDSRRNALQREQSFVCLFDAVTRLVNDMGGTQRFSLGAETDIDHQKNMLSWLGLCERLGVYGRSRHIRG